MGSHHNQALMSEDSEVITRSYHSFITLQRDTPTLSSLLYPLSRYTPLWSFLLSLTLILYLSLYHFTTQLQCLSHLFFTVMSHSWFVDLCLCPSLFIWHVLLFKFFIFTPSLFTSLSQFYKQEQIVQSVIVILYTLHSNISIPLSLSGHWQINHQQRSFRHFTFQQ